MSAGWTVDIELAAVENRLAGSIACDRELWREITRACKSGDEKTKHLALDLFILRSEKTWGDE